IHRRARLHRNPQYQPIQDPLRALLLGVGAGPATPDRFGAGSGTGALPRRPGAPDCRHHRAPEPEQEAASHPDLRGSAPAAASRSGTTSAAVELRHGFLPLSHPATGGPTAAEAHAFLADARSPAATHRRAVSPGGTHARRTRRLSGATTQSRRGIATAV